MTPLLLILTLPVLGQHLHSAEAVVTVRAFRAGDYSRDAPGIFVASHLVLTTHQLVSRARRVEANGHPCEVVRTDPKSHLALLRVVGEGRGIARLADRPAAVWDPVFLWESKWRVCWGLVSRRTTYEWPTHSHANSFEAEFNPSRAKPAPNAGVPILNDRDELVGIVTAMPSSDRLSPRGLVVRAVCVTEIRAFLGETHVPPPH